MNQHIHFSIRIQAPRALVWHTMLGRHSYERWTAAFCAGSHHRGSWRAGDRMRFLAPNGDGMVATIAQAREPEFLSIQHLGFIANGVDDTESDAIKAWAPAFENYNLAEHGPQDTEVQVDQQIAPEYASYMNDAWPKALALLKAECESAGPLARAVAISASVLRQRLEASGTPMPRVAVLLGSGWGGLADRVEGAIDIPYSELPAFPTLAVGGHAGQLRAGTLHGVPVLVLAGRKHAYETGDVGAMRGVVRTLAAAGVTVLVQTNAAGSLVAEQPPGALMLITDHLNLVQRSPLVDDADAAGDKRFVDMANAYDATLAEVARRVAVDRQAALFEGSYGWLLGPQFETPAEIRMARLLGAQAVGMSTVPETILARHAGLLVVGLSLITNMAAGMGREQLSHAHTLATAQAAGEHACDYLASLVPALHARAEADART